jgi:hypothetical protein
MRVAAAFAVAMAVVLAGIAEGCWMPRGRWVAGR